MNDQELDPRIRKKFEYSGMVIGIYIGWIITSVINGKVFADITNFDPLAQSSLTFITITIVSIILWNKGKI